MSPLAEPLSKLRFCVLASGEQSTPVWWNCGGITRGQDDLRVVFPRSSWTAAITRAAELAQAHHDQRTRAVGVYHLFRLPFAFERDIHRKTLDLEGGGYFSTTAPEAVWTNFLESNDQNGDAEEGPVDLGTLNLAVPSAWKRLAKVYRAAFAANIISIPFFRLEE